MNRERCWNCIYHQRTLVSTNTARPLFYTSICAKGFDLHPDHCPSFTQYHDQPSSVRVTEERGLCQESATE